MAMICSSAGRFDTSSPYGGGGGIAKAGSGLLYLSGDNTYSGDTSVNSGVLEVPSTGALPGYNASGVVSVADNATLAVAVGGQGDWNSGTTDDIAVLLAHATFSGGASFGIDTHDGDFAYATSIGDTTQGALGLVKLGANTLTLSAENTYTGGTTVNGGTLHLGSGAQAGVIRGALTINSGATVEADTDWSLGWTSGMCVSSIAINGGTLNFYGNSDNGGTSAGSITMTGGTISGEDFDWYNDGSVADPTLTCYASATVSSPINLRLINHPSTDKLTFDIAQGADLTVSGGINTNSPYGAGGGLAMAGPGELTLSGNLSFEGSLLVSGGTLVLSGGNTYAGGTSIDGGTLSFTAGALPISSPNITFNDGILQWAEDNSEDISAGLAPIGAGETATFDINGNDVIFASPIAGSGTLVKAGAGTLTLTAPGTLPSGLTIDDPDDLIVPGGVTMTATTAIVGMDVTLTAAVADPFGDCTGVTLTLTDANSNVVFTTTVSGPLQGGLYSATVDTSGWAPGAYTITATPTFTSNTHHTPEYTQATAAVNLTADTAIVGPTTAGYQESGASGAFKTVVDSAAYGGQYREMTGSDTGASVTYTFSGLAPGTYEIWANYSAGNQHPTNTALSVYDGLAAAGHLQTTFTIDEQTALSTSNWGVQSLDGCNWGWLYSGTGTTTVGTVYINNSDGILTAVLPYSGAGTEAPTLLLIADPQPEAPYDAGTLGGRAVSQDPVSVSNGQIMSSVASALGSVVNTVANTIAPVYNNLNALTGGALGFGMSLGATLSGFGMGISASGCCDCPPSSTNSLLQLIVNFLEPQRNYLPLFGTDDTLVDNGTNLLLTTPNGTVYQFSSPDNNGSGAYATGQWEKTTFADGEVDQATLISDGQFGQQVGDVQKSISSTAHAFEDDVYTYNNFTGDPSPGLLQSIVVRQWNGTTWVNEYQNLFTYDSIGDLQSVTTQYPTSGGWSAGDSYYYRYYTSPTYSQGNFIGFAHGLEYELTPQDVAAVPGGLSAAESLSDSALSAYASYYYQYDTSDRVTLETVDRGLRTETYTYTPGSDDVQNADGSYNLNVWTEKTVESLYSGGVSADGTPAGALYSTDAFYTNYLGQTLFSDLSDSTGADNTYAYYQYDSQGHPILQASSSAVGSLVSDHAGGTYTIQVSGGSGPVDVYAYYGSTTATVYSQSSPPPTTASALGGGVAGYLQATGIEDGLTGATDWQSSVDYIGYTANGITVYYTFDSSAYQSDNISVAPPSPSLSDAGRTAYRYTFYADDQCPSPTVASETTILPAVPTSENGSGASAQTVGVYDQQGNLIWSKDADGNVTYSAYDPITDKLTTTIADISSGTAAALDLTPPSGWTLPSDGISAETDYSYDTQGRLVQTLGPEHEAVVNPQTGQTAEVRTATWTVYEDAIQQIITAEGYETLDGSGNVTGDYLVNPVSVAVLNADGQVIDDIQATVASSGAAWGAPPTSGDVSLGSAPLTTLAALGDVTASSSAYVALTTYQYDDGVGGNKELVSSSVYTNIAQDDFNQTNYGYDSLGRLEWTKTPGGTYTWNVLDYRGLVQSTWVGTSIAGSSDGDPSDGGANGMTKVTDYAYNADGDVTSMTEYPGGTAADEITDYGYDSRDRLLWAMTYDGTNYTYTYNTYDNLGDVTKTQTYQAAAAWTVNPAGDTLLAESTTAYDTLGQVYQSSTYVEDTTQTPPTWTATNHQLLLRR